MAIRQFDKLNTISKDEKAKLIRDYFEEMELPEEEKEERIIIATELDKVFNRLFVLLAAVLIVENAEEIDRQFYYDYAYRYYYNALLETGHADLAERLNDYIVSTTMMIVDTTVDFADTQYYLSDERAVFTAMDETNAVTNYDREMQAIKDGYTRKQWITKHDNRVRKTHTEVDNKVIDINKTFTVGLYQMRFPLDTMLGAGPKEVVRCRCVCKYLK